MFQVGQLADGVFSKDGSIYRARVMPGGKLEKKNSLASLFPLAVRVHLASVKGARNTEKNRARVEAKLSGGEVSVCLDKRGAATFFKDGQEVVFRRPRDVANSTQTESDSEETTSPEESGIDDVVKCGATPEVNSSTGVEVKLFSGDKALGGAGAEGSGLEDKAEVVVEATGLSTKDSSIVDTGYLTEEEDLVESKAEVFEQTLNAENTAEGRKKNSYCAKGLVTVGRKEKSLGRKKTAGKKVTADVDKVARLPPNTVRRADRISEGEGGGRSRQRRDNPKTVKTHHSGWKVFSILYLS